MGFGEKMALMVATAMVMKRKRKMKGWFWVWERRSGRSLAASAFSWWIFCYGLSWGVFGSVQF